jgi:hypothetical protein
MSNSRISNCDFCICPEPSHFQYRSEILEITKVYVIEQRMFIQQKKVFGMERDLKNEDMGGKWRDG